jgi:alpha-aminoadipic semialdehyde synthase
VRSQGEIEFVDFHQMAGLYLSQGGLEFVDRHTTIDQPSFEGPGGVLISTTDILPTELPTDASNHFSSRILPYVQRLLTWSEPGDEVDTSIRRAKIVDRGQLTDKHAWLEKQVTTWRGASYQTDRNTNTAKVGVKKRVLLLGSGLVAGPAVDVFVARGDVQLVIG